jgi:hypothetical protein
MNLELGDRKPTAVRVIRQKQGLTHRAHVGRARVDGDRLHLELIAHESCPDEKNWTQDPAQGLQIPLRGWTVIAENAWSIDLYDSATREAITLDLTPNRKVVYGRQGS